MTKFAKQFYIAKLANLGIIKEWQVENIMVEPKIEGNRLVFNLSIYRFASSEYQEVQDFCKVENKKIENFMVAELLQLCNYFKTYNKD